ncbi:MAG TPA: hypothetical protein VFQ04_03610, partial [Actinomycetes bacterium]|nr:hypothetical protein [Actinomycetes bacterium]
MEGITTSCRVGEAGCVAMERFRTDGCVVGTFCVVKERFKPHARVPVAQCVVEERSSTNGGIIDTISEIKERIETL